MFWEKEIVLKHAQSVADLLLGGKRAGEKNMKLSRFSMPQRK